MICYDVGTQYLTELVDTYKFRIILYHSHIEYLIKI